MGKLQTFRQQIMDPDTILHFVLVGVPLGFGLLLAFDDVVFSTGQVYAMMRALANEATWAWITLGFIGLYAVSWLWGRFPAMMASHMLLTFWHGVVGLCMFMGNNHSANSPTYMVLAVAAALRLVGMAGRHG